MLDLECLVEKLHNFMGRQPIQETWTSGSQYFLKIIRGFQELTKEASESCKIFGSLIKLYVLRLNELLGNLSQIGFLPELLFK